MYINPSNIHSFIAASIAALLLSSCACCGKPSVPSSDNSTARAVVTSGGPSGNMDELKFFDKALKDNLKVATVEEQEISCLECPDLYSGITLPKRQLTYVLLNKNAKQMQCFADAWQTTYQQKKNLGLTMIFDHLPTPSQACNLLPQPCFAVSGRCAQFGFCDRVPSTYTCQKCD